MIKTGKDYKIKRVNKGVTKNGKPYTIVKIVDSKKDENGNWLSNNFAVFLLADVDVVEEGTISIAQIDAVDFKVKEWNDKTYGDCTIYADAKSILITNPYKSEYETFDPFAQEEMPF